MARTFEPPVPGAAPRLVQVSPSKTLEPTSIVTLVFRGGPPIVDKFDGRDFIVPPLPDGVALHEWQAQSHPPADFHVEYQVAVHLQTRAVVPGSRNPHTGRTASQLGVSEVDRPDRLTPFTPAQLKQFSFPEAIDRSAAELPSMRNVQVIDTADAVAEAFAAGQNIEERLEEAPGEDIRATPETHAGLAEVQEDEAAFEAAGGQASRTRAAQPRGRR